MPAAGDALRTVTAAPGVHASSGTIASTAATAPDGLAAVTIALTMTSAADQTPSTSDGRSYGTSGSPLSERGASSATGYL